MVVKIKMLSARYPECQEDNCHYRRECANHQSAGDWRSEDGLTPDLKKNVDGEWECSQSPTDHSGARFSDGTCALGESC